jgi:hypothetical protein
MRPRTSLILAAAGLTIIGFFAARLGQRGAQPASADMRRSTLLTGPEGARAWADALALLGVSVQRFRRRTTELPAASDSVLFAVLDPATPLSPLDAVRLEQWRTAGGHLLAAGEGADALLRCYGLRARPAFGSAVRLAGDSVRVASVLAAPDDSATTKRPPVVSCGPVAYRADTVLVTTGGAPFAMRLHPAEGGDVVVVADGRLFSNRVLRETDAGVFILGLVVDHTPRLVVDEYHQGFGPGGSMSRAAWAWLTRAPAGWVVLQLGAVAVLALLASAIRFGPARHVIERRRRSSLEHVRALATTLAAAGGHDAAVWLMVRGLRRRLSQQPGAGRGQVTEWLRTLPGRMRSDKARDAAERLLTLTQGRADASSVRSAALAVEDVWQDLTP